MKVGDCPPHLRRRTAPALRDAVCALMITQALSTLSPAALTGIPGGRRRTGAFAWALKTAAAPADAGARAIWDAPVAAAQEPGRQRCAAPLRSA